MPAYPGTEENSWWTAVGCTLLAVATVSSETAQQILPEDFVSHALGCGILALTFFCAFIALKSSLTSPRTRNLDRLDPDNDDPRHSVGTSTWAKRKEVTILRGSILKYSEKKEWGTISVQDSDSDSDVETRVRFLKTERDRLGLQPGEEVIFRAVKDQQMEGWLLAETIWKAPAKQDSQKMKLRHQSAKKQMD